MAGYIYYQHPDRVNTLPFVQFSIEETFMKIIFREMMLASISGWITLWIDPMIYVEMFVIGAVTYAVVAALEYRKIQKVPMDEALKM